MTVLCGICGYVVIRKIERFNFHTGVTKLIRLSTYGTISNNFYLALYLCFTSRCIYVVRQLRFSLLCLERHLSRL